MESDGEERSRTNFQGVELFVSLKEVSKRCKIPGSSPVSWTHALGLQGTKVPGGQARSLSHEPYAQTTTSPHGDSGTGNCFSGTVSDRKWGLSWSGLVVFGREKRGVRVEIC